MITIFPFLISYNQSVWKHNYNNTDRFTFGKVYQSNHHSFAKGSSSIAKCRQICKQAEYVLMTASFVNRKVLISAVASCCSQEKPGLPWWVIASTLSQQ